MVLAPRVVSSSSCLVTGSAVVLAWALPLVLTLSLLAPLLSPPCGLLRGTARPPPCLLGKERNLCLPPASCSSALSFFLASRASASRSSSCISLTADFFSALDTGSFTKFDSVATSCFLATVLSRASRAAFLAEMGFLAGAWVAGAGRLKLTRTICSLGEWKPLGGETSPTSEIPLKGVLSSSSSSPPRSTRF